MEENLKLPAYPRNKLNQLKDYPENQIYGIYDNVEFSGNLSGKGEIKKLENTVKKEIVSVLMLDKQIQILREHFPQISWVYYTSEKNFIYLVPKISLNRFSFNSYFYTQDFWAITTSQNNPNNETTITPLYQDIAGKGLMITISSPVVVDGNFRGVFSLDLGIEGLKKILNDGDSSGETVILSKDMSLVAKLGDVKVGETFGVPKELIRKEQVTKNNIMWISKLTNDGWMRVVHKLDLKKVFVLAVQNTYYEWIILFLFVLLEYTVLKLMRAFKDVTLFMNLDPLTRLLNRRGFYSEFQELEKIYEALAVLVIDVDYFKKINDSFGHSVGDDILQKIGELLISEKRENEICSRWGGEEFVIILVDRKEQEIVKTAKHLCMKISENVKKPDGEKLTVSVGVTFWHKTQDIDEIIDLADENLYKAKGSGRNCIYYNGNIYRNDKTE